MNFQKVYFYTCIYMLIIMLINSNNFCSICFPFSPQKNSLLLRDCIFLRPGIIEEDKTEFSNILVVQFLFVLSHMLSVAWCFCFAVVV